ncbi:hypothetical protein HCG51_20855 [Tolypothrix sp. PCC 7910]|uniref:hypothetical protein n=1 Tax=Tolypothrix sp. PCC 7910 TaxID=2099387 RepID=UPI00142782F3|nr:hypothetical protein [Tolypothrix sp. PCC 7910]QIR38912.1 hypothetical protein HCG51_20855 [Tolypothrix sp. PCC 7910]
MTNNIANTRLTHPTLERQLLNPVVSLSENNNRSETLEPLSNQPLSLSFLIETKIYSQKLKSKAPKGFQGLAFPSLT